MIKRSLKANTEWSVRLIALIFNEGISSDISMYETNVGRKISCHEKKNSFTVHLHSDDPQLQAIIFENRKKKRKYDKAVSNNLSVIKQAGWLS